MEDFSCLKDEEIIRLIRENNSDAMDYLLNKYKLDVRINAKSMFLIGGDNDDLIQEGMIGLYTAITDFDETKGVMFSNFANMCIRRRMQSAITASNRNKHQPLNTYISFSGYKDESQNDINVKSEKSPEELMIDKEKEHMIEYRLEGVLSEFELKVFSLWMQGIGYVDIADRLDKSPKSIDNALQRIKTKASEVITDINNEC